MREKPAEMGYTFQETARRKVRQYNSGFSGAEIEIVREIPFEVRLNGKHVATIACAGMHLEEMTLGYLRSEGLIGFRSDIKRFTISRDGKGVRVFTKDRETIPLSETAKVIGSSGARLRPEVVPANTGKSQTGPTKRVGAAFYNLIIRPKQILSFMRSFLASAEIHTATHGTHCSALADSRGIIAAREDIGRHNTLDMLAGHVFLNEIDCSDKIVLTTGRISSEIISKVYRMGVPVVISHSAATLRAIEQAEANCMTLIGYVRGDRFFVYTDPAGRIK